MSSSPWGKIAAVEAISLADIISEESTQKELDRKVQKYERICVAADLEKRSGTDCTIATTAAGNDDGNGDVPHVAGAPDNEGDNDNNDDDDDNVDDDDDDDIDLDEWEDCAALLKADNEADEALNVESCASDELIASLLQTEFDREYNAALTRIEENNNKGTKVLLSMHNYRRGERPSYQASAGHDDDGDDDDDGDGDDDDDDEKCQQRNWHRFASNQRLLETIPKCGFKVDKEGGMITKHDDRLCGVRNACRVMCFKSELRTGDGSGFDMKLSNQVYNQLKTYSHRGPSGSNGKKNKLHDRKENVAIAEMGLDTRTRQLIYKLINGQVLKKTNGIISTGKEAVILHANSDPSYAAGTLPPELMPKECAIKIFKTILNNFKQRDRYIKDDYRFKDRFSKQNKDVVINMWAEKEMHNLWRMQKVGINCPRVVIRKRHVLVMSFIGANNVAAPKLKDVALSRSELSSAYDEILLMMHKLYNEARLVHADLSEYNILWHDGKCWLIDVAQSVEPQHPSALEFLMRDCGNIINFFTKRQLANIYTKEQLFEYITALNGESHNVAALERIRTRGIVTDTDPSMYACGGGHAPHSIASYPFELAWEKSQAERQQRSDFTIVDTDDMKIITCHPCDGDVASVN